MLTRNEVPKCHLDTYDKWFNSGMTLRIDYKATSGVWVQCRSTIEWDKNYSYRINYTLED